MPSSQTALHLWVSMDALVTSRSSRSLLAFAWSSIASTRGVTLPVLEMAAIGEMLVGMSSREASATSVLTWDEVSAGQSGPSGLWGGVMGTTTGVGLLGEECLDLQLDVSSTAQDRRFLTSVVMLPSNYGGYLWGLATMMVETLPRGGVFWSGSSIGGDRAINPQVDRLACSNAYTAGQWFWQGGYNGLIMPIQTYRVDNLGASDRELADLKLADLPTGGCLCPSLR